MPDNYNDRNARDWRDELGPWVPTIIMLFFFFPVGIVMLILKLFGSSGAKREGERGRHPYDEAREQARRAASEARDAARQAASDAANAARQAASDATNAARQAASDATNAARQAANEARDAVRNASGGAKESVRQAAEEVRRAARDVRREAKNLRLEEKETRQEEQYAQKAASRAAQKAAKKTARRDKKDAALRKRADEGRGLAVGGGILAAVTGMVALLEIYENLSWGGLGYLIQYSLGDVFVPLGFCGAGLVMLYHGLTKSAKAKRYRKYLALIGRRDSISVVSLAGAMDVSVHRACDDLQDMLDAGFIPVGFLDLSNGRLILSEDGLWEEPPQAAPQPKREEPAAPKGMEREDAFLAEIRQVNEAIADPEMSRKIDRIGEITSKIFAYLRDKPDKEGQLRSFLSYYLPTTLKILRAYAQMEAQGIEGENITAAKARIEGMMDKVVDGFEKQLDKLFQDDAMDITTDVAVLERMLDKDGLGGAQGFQLGG